ncbi:unnamed protein product, partial [Didymodactylos carnosus]
MISALSGTAKLAGDNEQRLAVIDMKLAIMFKNIEKAKTQILTDENIVKWENEELDECLEEALWCGSVPFVELLLEFGATFKRLAAFTTIEYFYQIDSEKKAGRINEAFMQEYTSEKNPIVGILMAVRTYQTAVKDDVWDYKTKIEYRLKE